LEPEARLKNLNKMHDLRKFWPDGTAPNLPKINYFELVEKNEETALKKAVLSLLEHGMTLIEQVNY